MVNRAERNLLEFLKKCVAAQRIGDKERAKGMKMYDLYIYFNGNQVGQFTKRTENVADWQRKNNINFYGDMGYREQSYAYDLDDTATITMTDGTNKVEIVKRPATN